MDGLSDVDGLILRQFSAAEDLAYQVDLPPLSIAESFSDSFVSNGDSSAGGSDYPESPKDDILSRTSAFPPPGEFRINTLYIKSEGPRSDFDITATFDSNSGELVCFTDTLSLVADIPIEVLQSGFAWTDFHQKDFQCSSAVSQLVEKCHQRMKVMTTFIQTPGAKCAVFHEYFAFITPKGVLKKLEVYVMGIERRMEWRAREVGQLPITLVPESAAAPGADGVQKPKRVRKPRPPRRKRKIWEDKMNKFTVDPSVPPSLDSMLLPLPLHGS